MSKRKPTAMLTTKELSDAGITRIVIQSNEFPDIESRFLPGEKAAIMDALRAARTYGHGNIISWLRRDAAEMLRDQWGFTSAQARKSTNYKAYPMRKERRWPSKV